MSYLMVEYVCDRCDARYESLERRSAVPPNTPCADDRCRGHGSRAVSAPMAKVATAAVTAVNRGKSDPPPSPLAMNASERMGEDGRTRKEWKKERSTMWQAHDRRKRRERGLL